MERGIMRSGNNCCVYFKREDSRKEKKAAALATLGIIAFGVLMMVLLIKSMGRERQITISSATADGQQNVAGLP